MNVNVSHGLGDLARDMEKIPPKARKDMRDTVRDGVRAGAELARINAKRTSGTHGKHYPKSITASMNRGGGLFGNVISGEYGPDSAKKQGGMSFENGSKNQPPHRDLARSADIIGPSFAQEVRKLPDRWFW